MKNIKGKIKKILAVATGLALVGSTVLGATIDLSQYPTPFIKDGVFNGVLAIGDKAAAEDVIGVADIAVSLQYSAVTKKAISTKTGVEVEGDVFEIKTGGEDLNLFEDMNNVVSVVDKDDLDTLGTFTLTTSKGSFDYNQYLYLGSASVEFTAEGSASDDPKLYLKFKEDVDDSDIDDGSEALRYELTFPTAAKSDMESNGYLEDFDDEDLIILGKEYTITNANLGSNGKLKIELMGGTVNDVLEEGETKVYSLKGSDYEVTVMAISDETSKVKFNVNGETSRSLREGDTFTLDDGTQVGVREVIPNEAGDVTRDLVEFYLGAEKMVFEDSDGGIGKLTIGSNELDDIAVDMIWTNSSDELNLNKIQLVWQPSDEIYVPVEGKLSEYLEEDDDNKAFLAMSGLNFEFVNVIDGDEDSIKIKSSGGDNIKIELTTKSDVEIREELFWLNQSNEIVFGQNAGKELYFTNGDTACDEDLFITEKKEYSHVLQIKKISSDKIELRDLGTGDAEEISYSGTTATFYKEGAHSLTDINATVQCLTLTDITDDGDGTANLWTKNGAELVLDVDNATGNIIINEDGGDFVNITLLVSGNKLVPNSITTDSNNNLMIPLDSNDDRLEGYTEWGTFIEWNKDSDTIEVSYPEEQSIAKIYLTSGTTKLVPSTEGMVETELINRIEVGATKLASEIIDIKMQNLIAVGGPCANAISATLMGDPEDCTMGYPIDRGIIELFEHENGNIAILVAGLNAKDTKKAAGVLSDYDSYQLKGKKVIIDTTTGKLIESETNTTGTP